MTAAMRIPRAPSGTPAILVRFDCGMVGFLCTACRRFNRVELALDCPADDPGSHSCRCGQWHSVATGRVSAV